MDLRQLGWNDAFATHFRPFADLGLVPARVATEHRGGYDLYGADAAITGEVSGRFRHEALCPSDFPAVGDWVAVEYFPAEAKALIHAVLPRRTKFSRMAAGDVTEEQVLAANMDEVLIVASLNAELNLRRIERYMTLAWESGANPVLILTKTDLCEDIEAAVAEVTPVAGGAPILALSGVTGQGMDELHRRLVPGVTAALLGSSGVGKSTLINHLCGTTAQAVQPVRETDDKGRHTTTRREMICLPSGALIIDTPGLRELQLWHGEEGLGETFTDIETLAIGCRFTDCRHEAEPGCAVLAAIASGELDSARLESHRKLQRELSYFQRRHDIRAQAADRRRTKTATKQLRGHKKGGP